MKVEFMHPTEQRPLRSDGRAASERGYILLILSLFAALIAIGLMQVLPAALVETQREREEELVFRGQQYQRAIQLYVRKFGRYPNSLDDLEETNGVRFLRHRYRDPVTGEEEWRMIHIGPGGTFPDSKTVSNPGGTQANTGLAPTTAGAEPRGFSEQPSQFEAQSSGFGGAAAPAQPAAAAPGQPDPAAGLAPLPGQDPQQVPPALRPSADPSANPAQQPRAAGVISTTGGAQQPGTIAFAGGGIAGVASNSTEASIKIYNGYQQYDEWEFIYNYQADQLAMAAAARGGVGVAPGGIVPGAAQPGLPGQPGAPPPGVMTSSPGAQVPGVPFPAPFGSPGVAPRFPASQSPGVPPGVRPGQGQFPGARPGTTPGATPGNQPQSPFSPSPFPGSSGFSTTPSPRSPSSGFGSQTPRTQPGQGFPTSPIPGFPTNPQQPRR